MNLFRLPCGIPWGGARRLVLTLACLFALSGLSAQNVTLRFERAKLKTVMDEITRQCDLSFAYSREVVDADRIVSIDLKDAPIDAALQSLFPSGNGIDYAIKNRKILLSAGKQAVRVDSVIKGRVADDKGQPVVGATVVVVGTTQGTTTGLDGEFSLRVAADDPVLKVDFLGYEPQELRILPSQTTFDITLVPSSKEIDAVVVTALGITRKEKSLGYAVSKVSSEDLANTAGGNWLSGMAGKVAGLNLDQSSAGPGGSIRVTLRGEGSLSHDNNSALFVVDGVPINSGMSSNTTSGSYDAVDAPIDYGNGAGDINPDDVESVSVLKGPAATALYGSRAANGAIVITTKSGRKQKGIGITFSTGITWEKPGFWPDFQYEYGAGDYRKSTLASHMSNGITPDEYSFYTVPAEQSYNGEKISSFHSRYQFGEKVEGQLRYMYRSYDRASGTYTRVPYEVCDWYKGFFDTGVTYTNSVAVDASDGHGSQLRVSVKDARTDWIVPNTGYDVQTFSVSALSKRNKYIEAGVKLTYYRKDSDNLPISGYSNSSPLKSLIWQPTSASVDDLYNEWSSGLIRDYYAGVGGIKLCDSSLDNPYFVAYEQLNTMDRDRIYGNMSVTGHIIPEQLSLTLRAGVDFSNDFRTQQKPQYSHSYTNGMYREQTVRNVEFNTDFLLSWRRTFGDFYLNASLGGNAMLSNNSNVSLLANQLDEPNVFILQNVSGQLDVRATRTKKAINSFYGFLSMSWRDMIFIDVTGRNDWSSTLAPGYNSYFYPSFSGSVLLDQVFDFAERAPWVDLLKVRGSWANVGNDTDPYNLLATYANSPNFTGAYLLPSETLNYDIKPENVESWEVGLEASFFKKRLAFDVAYYFSETTDQIINVPSDWATGASSILINAGCVRNKGVEVAANFVPVATKDWRWSINLNWSKNWNKLVELADGVEMWQLNAKNTVGSRVFVYAYPGTELGRIYGVGYERAPEGAFYYDEAGRKVDCGGEVVVNAATGNPVLGTEVKDLGSIYPQWKAGMTSSLRYKNLSLNMTFAASYGGRAYSLTNAILAYMGKTTASLPGRYDGLVHPGVNRNEDGTYAPNRTVTTDIVEYYNLYTLNRNNVEANTFDTSYLKMKELRIEYSLPKRICSKLKVFQNITLGVYATNLFCITNWPQFDPEVASLSGSSLYRGVETGGFPMTRNYGFSLKLGF